MAAGLGCAAPTSSEGSATSKSASAQFFIDTNGDPSPALVGSGTRTPKAGDAQELGAGSKLSRRQKLTIASLTISNFCASLAFSIIAPFYPQEASNKGASDTEIGLIFGVFQLTVCFMSPIYGTVITTVGPKFMYVSGCFMCSVCLILFGFLDKCPDGQIYVAMCFICRIVEANGSAMLVTASFAIMANQFPNQLSTVMGMLEAFSGIGMMVGPPVGGALYSVGGFRLPFLAVGCLLIVSCASSYVLLPLISSARGVGRFLALLKIPKLVVVFFVMCSATFALGFLDPTLAKHVAKVAPGLTPAQIGAVFLIGCGVYALTAPLIGYLCDKGFLLSLILMGSVLCGAGYLVIGPTPLLAFLLPNGQLWTVCLALTFIGLGVGSALLPTFPLALRSALKAGYSEGLETQGLISGFFNCALSLGAFLGPTVAGAVSAAYGFEWAATGCAFLAFFVAGIIVCTIIVSRDKGGPASMLSVTENSSSHVDYTEASPLLSNGGKNGR